VLDTKDGAGNMIYLPLDRLLERNATRSPAPQPGSQSGAEILPELPNVTVDGRSRGVR
jgi:hypothetical protein